MSSAPLEQSRTHPPVPRPRTGSPALDGVGSRLTEVIPAPVSVRPTPGVRYLLTAGTTIRTSDDPAALAVGEHLADLLRPATGHPLPVATLAADDTPPADTVTLLLEPATEPAPATEPDGGYRLDVTAEQVVIRAATATGLFYGVQTLRQLLPAEIESTTVAPGPWEVPGGQIVDAPRFAYRGAMLDVSRHFFEMPDVLRFVDQLARYKLNHLHLHLTDDQGWRIAIASWPRLAEIGGATEVDGGTGGYYTQADYRTIVEYAAARRITVVPEIDLPGHTNAALSAYGELAPDGVAPAPYTGTEVGFSSVAVASERTYDFVDDVLGELAALTPGPYLHIGGDEAFKLDATDYGTVMNRVQRIVAAKSKTVVGWHQLAPAEHVPGRVLQYWGTTTSDENVASAVRQGARVIMSPGNRTYLDMKYTDATTLGQDWAGLIDVRTAYDWDPGTYLDGVPAESVLGVEAPLWTETIRTVAEIEFMTYPRLVAVAELAWSPATTHDWDNFRLRLAAHSPRWTHANIHFHPSPEIPWPPTQ
ncbi:beta-N-acetylhexosaminidase [Micromonospora sp. NBC_01796]|uniref:beta-N-acetylhexosaminidase n=1 Tax=Micromonospora sp. NBC_01796 TaxID=2975987 RepID=UPI002DD9A94F|nr:beta-N-acetylhexosaminidase [Micromonospora sp. NBC_01796]WSA83000.1 beta-N-acetylhexosaminidase [Micromonospora sp. NBC_01796]